jgi:hypothetical protein
MEKLSEEILKSTAVSNGLTETIVTTRKQGIGLLISTAISP